MSNVNTYYIGNRIATWYSKYNLIIAYPTTLCLAECSGQRHIRCVPTTKADKVCTKAEKVCTKAEKVCTKAYKRLTKTYQVCSCVYQGMWCVPRHLGCVPRHKTCVVLCSRHIRCVVVRTKAHKIHSASSGVYQCT